MPCEMTVLKCFFDLVVSVYCFSSLLYSFIFPDVVKKLAEKTALLSVC